MCLSFRIHGNFLFVSDNLDDPHNYKARNGNISTCVQDNPDWFCIRLAYTIYVRLAVSYIWDCLSNSQDFIV